MIRHPITNEHPEVEADRLVREHGRDGALAIVARNKEVDHWHYWNAVEHELRLSLTVLAMQYPLRFEDAVDLVSKMLRP